MKTPISLLLLSTALSSFSQVNVALDNWYNRETNSKTGKPYHYIWTDTENSGFSRLGEVFISGGAKISTLGTAPDKKMLSDIQVYIIVDPDTLSENPNPNYISKSDAEVISKWVKKGGVLLLMANDGPNCEFTHLNMLAGKFGIHFNPVSLNLVTGKDYEMGAETNLPEHPLFIGVNKIYMKEVSSISTSGNAKKILMDAGNCYIAESKYGKGFVLAIGDPWLYNEYIDNDRLPAGFENRKAAENLVSYLFNHKH